MKENDLFVCDVTDEIIINNSEPRNANEETLLKILLSTFGEFTTIPKISKTLKISKTSLYLARDDRKFVTYLVQNRTIVLTKTLINFMRTYED